MKPTVKKSPASAQPGSAFRFALGLAATALLFCCSTPVLAQTDDFSDGDDTVNPAWTHLSGLTGSSGQSWTVAGGTYRLQAPNNGISGYGFAGSYAGLSHPDGRVEADFVSFLGPGANPVFGVAARLNGNNSPLALTGYGYVYEPFAAGLTGEMVLYRIDPGGLGTDIGSQQVSLDPSKDYRFVLSIYGTSLHGQVFEIGGGMVAERFATDATYTTGFSGVWGFGRNGVTPPTDFTVDNVSIVPEPGVSTLAALGAIGLAAARRFRQPRR